MKSLLRDIKHTLIFTIIIGVICCVGYPLVVYGVGQALFKHKADGSLIVQDGKVVGSELLGQPFTSDKYFIPRSVGGREWI